MTMEVVSNTLADVKKNHAGFNVDNANTSNNASNSSSNPTITYPTSTFNKLSITSSNPIMSPNNAGTKLNLSGELYTKHPLEHTWVLWYFKQEKGKDWSEGQKRVASVDTAEDFWALYNYIQPASCINIGCDYSFFKDGIFPMWEDEQNKKGGRWIVNMDKRVRTNELDHCWLESLLAVVGEAFDDYSEQICGLVVNIRGKADKLALWTRNCEPIENTKDIGRIFKAKLHLSKDASLDYQPHHASALKTGNNMSKGLYYL